MSQPVEISSLIGSPGDATPQPPSDLRVTLLIARRSALEALRDRMTLLLSLFFAVVLPLILTVTTILPLSRGDSTERQSALVAVLAVYLLIIGMMPSSAAVGIAAGQFAGEKEKGNLTPLLASPASNLAIFAGKVLGSIAPPLLFSLVAEATYLIAVTALTGFDTLHRLPRGLSLAMVALVPAASLLAATVASLISSRVRTFNTAQQISGLALIPLWGAVVGLSFELRRLNSLMLLAIVLGFFAIDLLLVVAAAATWRREEVLARQ